MRFLKRSNLYRSQSGKCTFDPVAMTAWSYSWWQFVAYIDGKVYFNGYHYSMPTGCHQRAVRQLLRDHGIKWHYVSYAAGLHNISGQISIFERKIERLKAAIAAPRTHKRKNVERRASIALLRQDIKLARRLMRLKRGPFPASKLRNFPPVPPPVSPEERKRRAERSLRQRRDRLYRASLVRNDEAVNQSFGVIQGGASLSRSSKAMLTIVKGGAQ